ncbi:Atxe2 family lasso peptide isopeptidase [Luteimonas sp. XNQY3]|nr:Atxe2 family lasso peptide isopeptidase [Luteimonas sp. XNQY3]MCD9006332.1 Atxe2 family lasso peptide isopeptidase [Luteimonas sp. XNQY3]
MLSIDWGRRCAGALMGLCVLAGPVHAVPPRALLEVVDFSGVTVSPDGAHVAFRTEQASVERNVYDTVWYVQGLADPLPRRIADGGALLHQTAGNPLEGQVTWSPDGQWIYYLAQIDGRADVWRAAANGAGAAAITEDAADVRAFELSEDGRFLRYSVGATREAVIEAEQAEYDRGIRIDAGVPIGQGLFRSGKLEGRLATQRFGEAWFDRRFLLDTEPDHWHELNLATGERRALPGFEPRRAPTPVLPRGVEGDPWTAVREHHGTRVAALTRIGEQAGNMARPDVLLSVFPVKGRAATHCESPLCRQQAITGVQWRPGHDEVLFTITDPKTLAQSLNLWSVDVGNVRVVSQARGLLNGGRYPAMPCGLSADAAVCISAEADQPPRLERISLHDGSPHVLFDPNAALARDIAHMAPPRLLRWTDESGYEYAGHFYAAKGSGEGPAPLFVTYYSCPGFVRGGVGNEWPLASLAVAGISALCINQRQGFAVDAIARHRYGLEATRSVVDLLSEAGIVDRTRVGMGGLSFGSAVTLWTATESDLLAAASSATPVVSPLYHLFASMKGDGFAEGLQTLWQLGSPEETPDRWHALSPAFKLDRLHAPVLFQHSEQEYLYGMDYMIPLLRERRAELYVFPHEPHQKFQPRHKLAVYERNLDWFRFWLKDEEDPAPAKAAQYTRWQEMRARQAVRYQP